MAASSKNPAAGGCGARKTDRFCRAIVSENIPLALAQQAKIVAAFIAAIDPALIAVVVALAMGGTI